MTNNESWHAIMEYKPFDKIPVIHWGGWQETYAYWHEQGMPKDANEWDYFGAVHYWDNPTSPAWPDFLAPLPPYEEKVLEDHSRYLIRQNKYGVKEKISKDKSSLPQSIGFTLCGASDWPDFKKRLQPDASRIPKDYSQWFTIKKSCAKAITISSGMGWLRDWMGLENMCYLAYDAPDCFFDIVNTLAELTVWFLDEAINAGMLIPDVCLIWEDISGKTGPLISPEIFKKLVAPGYRKMRDALDKHGIPYMCVDTDGDADALIGPFMDAGVNMLLPIEIGTWGENPERIRRKYGKELRMIGGFDKLVLEKDKRAIDEEFNRHVDLIASGGYLMMPDHLITPATPLDNYRYYLDKVRTLYFN
jgi:uroporphyrinogen decarboxylase